MRRSTFGFAFAFSLCSLALLSPQAQAVPGLSSSNSVKDLVRMFKSYVGTSGGAGVSFSSIHEIEQQLRQRPTEAGEALIAVLDTTDENLKLQAALMLTRIAGQKEFQISDKSLKTLTAYIQASKNPQIQATLLRVLGHIGPKNDLVKATIIDALKKSRESAPRNAAIDALAELAREEKPASQAESTATLVEVLKKDENPSVRGACASALGICRSQWQIAIPALTEALGDNYLQVRSRVAQSLGHYGSAARSAVPALLSAVKTETDSSMRHYCLQALRSIAPTDPEVISTFIGLVDDPLLGHSVLSYFPDMGEKAAPLVPKLITFLKDPAPLTRFYAARALSTIGPQAKPAIPALTEALQDSDLRVRRFAETALRSINPQEDQRATNE